MPEYAVQREARKKTHYFDETGQRRHPSTCPHPRRHLRRRASSVWFCVPAKLYPTGHLDPILLRLSLYELLEVRLDVVPALVSSLTRHAPCAHCQRAAISAFADDAADASRVPVLAMAAQVVFHGGELDSTLSVAFAHMPNNP